MTASPETSAADTAIPQPTPAKCKVERPDRLAATRRSITTADAKMSTNALANPPMKRSPMKAVMDDEKPIIPVVAALTASVARSETRRPPGSAGFAAAKAPSR